MAVLAQSHHNDQKRDFVANTLDVILSQQDWAHALQQNFKIEDTKAKNSKPLKKFSVAFLIPQTLREIFTPKENKPINFCDLNRAEKDIDDAFEKAGYQTDDWSTRIEASYKIYKEMMNDFCHTQNSLFQDNDISAFIANIDLMEGYQKDTSCLPKNFTIMANQYNRDSRKITPFTLR